MRPDLRVLGGVMFLDPRLQRTEGGTYDGNIAPGMSRTNVNIGAEWDTPFLKGLTLAGRMIATGRQYVDNANTQSIPNWVRFDIGARYTFEPVAGRPITIRASVLNVADNRYWMSGGRGLVLGDPRTYLLSTTIRF